MMRSSLFETPTRGRAGTAIAAVAAILLAASPARADEPGAQRSGFYFGGHVGYLFGNATATFAEAAQYGTTPPTINPIATADWPTPARRPANSRLDCSKLGRTFGIALPDWRNALSRTLKIVYNVK